MFVLGSLQHAVFLCGQRLSLVCQRQVALGEERQVACAIGHHMMDVHQQVVRFGCGHDLSPYQRLIAHDVEGAAKAVVSIVLEVSFRHLATHHCQFLFVIDRLPRFAIFVDEEADAQFFSCRKDGLHGSLHAVAVDFICQGNDARDVVLHHLRIFQAVVKDAQL